MDIDDILEAKKTLYSILDEHGVKSTITIDKWAADLLQGMLIDVHQWIQERYNLVTQKRPHLTRREKGDVVRMIAYREAEKSPNYKSLTEFL